MGGEVVRAQRAVARLVQKLFKIFLELGVAWSFICTKLIFFPSLLSNLWPSKALFLIFPPLFFPIGLDLVCLVVLVQAVWGQVVLE